MSFLRSTKIILGVMSIWPVCFGFAYVLLGAMFFPDGTSGIEHYLSYKILAGLFVATIILLQILIIGYMVLVLRYQLHKGWLFWLFAGNYISVIVFWYLYIWQATDAEEIYGELNNG